MSIVICTLFENHYHYGVAALANSLYQHGFRGDMYIGYRGALPSWTNEAKENPALNWKSASTMDVAKDFQLHFLPVDTDRHFTNYKPNFMLQLLNGPAQHAEGIAYFDPDIVNKCRWDFYETWISHGVALVHEIVHNDKPASHPMRLEWEKLIKKYNRQVTHSITSYISGGFCGVSRNNIEFLHTWADFIEFAIKDYNANPKRISSFDKTHPFCFLDQDAFNVTAMCCECPISEIGPEGMDFIGGGWTMSHAIGSPKPWKKKFIWSALKGNPPSMAEKTFWNYVKSPISNFGPFQIKIKQAGILAAGFIGRFYRRH